MFPIGWSVGFSNSSVQVTRRSLFPLGRHFELSCAGQPSARFSHRHPARLRILGPAREHQHAAREQGEEQTSGNEIHQNGKGISRRGESKREHVPLQNCNPIERIGSLAGCRVRVVRHTAFSIPHTVAGIPDTHPGRAHGTRPRVGRRASMGLDSRRTGQPTCVLSACATLLPPDEWRAVRLAHPFSRAPALVSKVPPDAPASFLPETRFGHLRSDSRSKPGVNRT